MIERGAAELGIAVPTEAAERLARFLLLLAKWNRTYNLTAITEPEAMVARHVLDSLSGAPWIRGVRALDIGTGAGLPGVPLAIVEPDRRWVLLDSRDKRIQFLTYARHDLDLENVTVVRARFEKYEPEGKFDTLTARAFSALPDLVRGAMPFILAGARLVAWTGSDPTRKLAETLDHQSVCHAVYAVRVPGVDAQRHIVVIDAREGTGGCCPAP